MGLDFELGLGLDTSDEESYEGGGRKKATKGRDEWRLNGRETGVLE